MLKITNKKIEGQGEWTSSADTARGSSVITSDEPTVKQRGEKRLERQIDEEIESKGRWWWPKPILRSSSSDGNGGKKGERDKRERGA